MKKLLLSALAIVSLAAYTACSSDSAIDNTQDNTTEYAYRNNAWEGEIGIERDGEYVITAHEPSLRADLEALLAEQGMETTLGTLTIIEKRLTNSTTEFAYVLIGTDAYNRTVGVSLTKSNKSLALEDPLTTVATTCSGCAQGCNLQYLLIDGQKVPYCNENGCDYDCTKSESSLF
ncbi:MAG: hypothetical protein ACO1N9_08130 [Flavobacterium sp.]